MARSILAPCAAFALIVGIVWWPILDRARAARLAATPGSMAVRCIGAADNPSGLEPARFPPHLRGIVQ